MRAPDLDRLLGLQLAAGLAEQRVDEQATAHADATVDAPHRELDAHALERFAPCEHLLVHAVHERAVEIEQEGGAGWHESGNVIVVNEVGAQHAAPLRLCVTPPCYLAACRLYSTPFFISTAYHADAPAPSGHARSPRRTWRR